MLTGAEEGKHGASPTVVVGDEMHEWRSRVIAETLEEGTGARLQWMFLYGSTAGPKTNPAGQECWDESHRHPRRPDRGSAHPGRAIFAAAPDDDPFDEALWRKANPSLGISPTLPSCAPRPRRPKSAPALAASAATTSTSGSRPHVRWLNRSQEVGRLRRPPATAGRSTPRLLKGAPASAPSTSRPRDVTARVLVFPPHADDPKWRLLCRFWVPEDTPGRAGQARPRPLRPVRRRRRARDHAGRLRRPELRQDRAHRGPPTSTARRSASTRGTPQALHRPAEGRRLRRPTSWSRCARASSPSASPPSTSSGWCTPACWTTAATRCCAGWPATPSSASTRT
jgi:hypothetical protein